MALEVAFMAPLLALEVAFMALLLALEVALVILFGVVGCWTAKFGAGALHLLGSTACIANAGIACIFVTGATDLTAVSGDALSRIRHAHQAV